MKKYICILIFIASFLINLFFAFKLDLPNKNISSSQLNYDILINRENNYNLIEYSIGVVIDKNFNGKMLNASNPDYNYISYKGVENVKVGDIIITKFYYDNSSDVDGINKREDIIIQL